MSLFRITNNYVLSEIKLMLLLYLVEHERQGGDAITFWVWVKRETTQPVMNKERKNSATYVFLSILIGCLLPFVA